MSQAIDEGLHLTVFLVMLDSYLEHNYCFRQKREKERDLIRVMGPPGPFEHFEHSKHSPFCFGLSPSLVLQISLVPSGKKNELICQRV